MKRNFVIPLIACASLLFMLNAWNLRPRTASSPYVASSVPAASNESAPSRRTPLFRKHETAANSTPPPMDELLDTTRFVENGDLAHDFYLVYEMTFVENRCRNKHLVCAPRITEDDVVRQNGKIYFRRPACWNMLQPPDPRLAVHDWFILVNGGPPGDREEKQMKIGFMHTLSPDGSERTRELLRQVRPCDANQEPTPRPVGLLTLPARSRTSCSPGRFAFQGSPIGH